MSIDSRTHETQLANTPSPSPPPISRFSGLKPTNLLGLLFVLFCSGLTALSIYLSTSRETAIWLAGQVLLSLAMLQWFALLHEAGHKTLFRTSRLNYLAGHLAGFFAVFPFECWKLVHGMHHRWTGWQDLDVTTSALVPRKLAWWEKLAVNLCWRLWLPLFSILYRLDNYWNLRRLLRLFAHKPVSGKLVGNVVLLLAAYTLTGFLVGPLEMLRLVGLGLLLTLMMQDPLILSQHTHVPMKLSDGETVDPIPPLDQEVFTRSLKFPSWFSNFVLLNMDAHELHHMYTGVPGYFLLRIDYDTQNHISWWQWLVRAKRVRGEVLLFQNRNETGFDI